MNLCSRTRAICPVALLISIFLSIVSLSSTVFAQETKLRVATVNGSLYRDAAGVLATELESGESKQAVQLAALIQIIRPDILLVNEIDYDADHRAVEAFRKLYLAHDQITPQNETTQALDFPYFYAGPVNTGVNSGMDLGIDGKLNGLDDNWGFGRYEGQYGMVVLSRFPIQTAKIRSFQKFRWAQLTNPKQPVVPETGKPYYSDAAWQALRLSSKSHWDVPIDVDGKELHILASHPTPPAFDGPEKRNGCRNHDEIRLWVDYLSGGDVADTLVDDNGTPGGLDANAPFVLLGDLNSDPTDGSGNANAIRSLLQHPRVTDPQPKSRGAVLAARTLAGKNIEHRGDPALDTSQFEVSSVGNLRVDFCLPSSNVQTKASGVFWPVPGERGASLMDVSDHRLVWVDIQL